MANPSVITKALAASSVNKIATSQTGSSGVALTLNGAAVTGGTATLDTQRRVLVTSAGNDSGITFAILGTNETGNPIFERVTGASGAAVASLQDYLTITSVTPSSGTASGVQIGTNGTGSSPWNLVNSHITPTKIGLAGTVTVSTGTWGIEYTYDAPQGVPPNVGNIPWTYPVAPVTFNHPVLQGQTGTADGAINELVAAWRLTLTAGTGTVVATGRQAGISQ